MLKWAMGNCFDSISEMKNQTLILLYASVSQGIQHPFGKELNRLTKRQLQTQETEEPQKVDEYIVFK